MASGHCRHHHRLISINGVRSHFLSLAGSQWRCERLIGQWQHEQVKHSDDNRVDVKKKLCACVCVMFHFFHSIWCHYCLVSAIHHTNRFELSPFFIVGRRSNGKFIWPIKPVYRTYFLLFHWNCALIRKYTIHFERSNTKFIMCKFQRVQNYD